MTNHGISSEHLPAADAAAWSLLSLLFFCVLCFAIGAWVLWRRENRRAQSDLEAHEAGQAVEKTPSHNSSEASQKKNREPWERDENWWKK